jgi:hypothetical protein
MKKIITAFTLFIFSSISYSVKAQEPPPKTTGKVSHEFKKTGCGTVVIIENPAETPIILIPRTPLPKKLDKNGMMITFNYKTLRTPNPRGCEKGRPAELSDVQKK